MAAVGTIIAGLAYLSPRQAAPEPAPPPQPRDGSIELRSSAHTLFYPKDGILPASPPPVYPASEEPGHCDEWDEWAVTVEAAPVTSSLDIGTNASVTSPITIKDVQLRVLYSEPMAGPDRIRCQYGAGGELGASLRVDLENPIRRIPMDVDSDGEPDTTLPGGVFAVDSSKAETLVMLFEGKTDHVYALIVDLKVVENGVERMIRFGSDERPLLVALLNSDFEFSPYDWNFGTMRWEPARF